MSLQAQGREAHPSARQVLSLTLSLTLSLALSERRDEHDHVPLRVEVRLEAHRVGLVVELREERPQRRALARAERADAADLALQRRGRSLIRWS